MLSWWCRRSTTTTRRPLTRFQIRTLVTEQQTRSLFNKNGWEAVIGIEVHAQINSKTKLFSGKLRILKKGETKQSSSLLTWKTRVMEKKTPYVTRKIDMILSTLLLFIDMETSYEEPPNSKVSTVDLAFPGVQPVN